jgi:DNA-binding response OmpR family regulator
MSAVARWCQAGAGGRRPRPAGGRIAEGLRHGGLAVDVARGGSAALTQAGLTAYDVIVLGRDLPVVHGEQAARTA